MPVRTRLLAAAAILIAGLSTVAVGLRAQASALTRGPYLQLGTPTSVIVRWRTAVATDSMVRYGTVPGALSSVASMAAATTEHAVRITGLAPHTRYFYSIGSTTSPLAGGDLDHTFVTAPPRGARASTRIWVLGDPGTANADARRVRDGAMRAMHWREPDLWLMLGDNAYASGSDAEYQAAVFDMYPATLRRAVLWPTLGNHDAITADSATQSGPYYDIFTLPTAAEAGGEPSGTEAYYSFDYGNVHIVCLDSSESDRRATGAMLTWLRADLAATRAEWTVAYFHHPPYSKGSHDSDVEIELRQMREEAGPILEAGGVDLVLAGHSHSYERSLWLSGHYGPSTTLSPSHLLDGGSGDETVDGGYRKSAAPGSPGTLYITLGSSGKITAGPLNHPAMRRSTATLGSLVLDIEGPRMDVRFVTPDEREPGNDLVTLIKHTPGAAPGAPTHLAAEAGNGRLALTWKDGGEGRPSAYVVEAGSAPGRTDLASFSTGRLATTWQAPIGPGRYAVRVRAANGTGVSAPSNEIELMVGPNGETPPPPPRVIAATQAGTSVSILSAPSSSTSPLADVVLEVGRAPGQADVISLPVPPAFSIADVPTGAFFARLRGRTSAGLGPPSRELQFVVGGVPALPGAPVGPRAAVLGSTVALTWAPPASGTPPAAYIVEAGTQPGGTDFRLPTSTAAPSIAFANVPAGTYFVRVHGVIAVGAGLASDELRLRVP